MADKQTDRPDEQGMVGFAKRNFGAGERGEPYGERVRRGVGFALTAGLPHAKDVSVSVPFFGALLTGLGGALALYGAADVTITADQALSAQIESGAGVSFLQVGRGTHLYRYMLVSTNDGYALYQSGDYSDTDDRLALVTDPVEALTTVMQVSLDLSAIADAAANDLRSMPRELPSLIRYERVSPLFQQAGDPDSYYRVGDNMSVIDAPLSLEQVQRARAVWQEAARTIVNGDYAAPPEAVQTGDHIHDGNLLWQALVGSFAAYAGFAGLGALGGAVSATASSRRRAKRERSPS